jgi:hypothetical protein
MKTKKTKLFMLIAEDASHLGGPMGSEYTTHMWSKPFSSVEKARAYAEKFAKRRASICRWNIGSSWDAGWVTFDIKKVEVD